MTINHKGLIYMNALAHEAMGKPPAVALYFSRAEDAIAIEPAGNPHSTDVFEVVPKQNGFAIHASTFCRHYKIRVKSTERFVRPQIGKAGTMILRMRETVTVGGIGKQ